ncbi:MAG: 50S ribosomal protein L3 [Chloroflexota bacterium]|nr:50S ribosomal protein L3 [Chloroflexota bacterium]MDQ6907617.1 50S ribosomal protein L3 [Chloroflexota bacterium]
MLEGLLGKKLGMTQVFDPTGRALAVTVIETGPCIVTQLRTQESDGYNGVQLGFGTAKRLNRPDAGHLRASGANSRDIREIRTDGNGDLTVGQTLTADAVFKAGDTVDVTGQSKGKGFAGVVKRHHFAGGPKTHGQSDRHRAPGSVGAGTTPGRVFKGLKMAGHMGNERVTVQNLRVVDVDVERNLVLVAGAVPGANGGLVTIRQTVKNRRNARA